MRAALACLAVVVLGSPVGAEPSSRARVVVDALGVDVVSASRLTEVVAHHDAELDRMQRERAELRRRLVAAQDLDPATIDRLLDEAAANRRALALEDEILLVRVRQIVSARQAARLLTLLAATEPAPGASRSATEPQAAPANRLIALPPSSRPPCDPFASMHGCRY